MYQIQFKIRRPDSKDEIIDFDQDKIMLGRDSENQIVLNDSDVSRVHSTIYLKNERWHIKDLNSTNGTFVNGVPIKDKEIKPGDLIIAGKCKLHFMQIKETTEQAVESGKTTDEDESYKIIQIAEPSTSDAESEPTKENVNTGKLSHTLQLFRDGFNTLSNLFVINSEYQDLVTFDKLVEKTAHQILEMFHGIEYCMIETFDAGSSAHEKLAVVTYSNDHFKKVEPDHQLREKVAQEKKGVISRVNINKQADSDTLTAICQPLLMGDQFKGIIYLGSERNLDQFEQFDLDLIGLFAIQITIAFENFHNFKNINSLMDEYRKAYEREPLFEKQILNFERVRQLNNVAQSNLNEMAGILRRIGKSADYLDTEIPTAHWTRPEVNSLIGESKKAANLCDKLMTYSRRGKIHIARFHPTQMLMEIIDLTRGMMGETIWIEADLPDDLPLIEYDALLFEQFLISLMILFRNSMLGGGMLKLDAHAMDFDEQFVQQKNALSKGPGIQITMECTGSLDFEGMESTRTNWLMSSDKNEFRRIRQLMFENNALLEIERNDSATAVHLYFQQSAVTD